MSKLELKNNIRHFLNITPSLQEALHILSMPIQELAQWLQLKVESNPFLQYEDDISLPSDQTETHQELDFDQSRFEILDELDETFVHAIFDIEGPVLLEPTSPTTLNDSLLAQAREEFSSAFELQEAEQIIGNLDCHGLLDPSYPDSPILFRIQQFDPPGIGARNVREALLIQLQHLGKQETLAWYLVKDHFEELLKGRVVELSKILRRSLSELRQIVYKEILCLHFFPAQPLIKTLAEPKIPDVYIDIKNGEWAIRVEEDLLPKIFVQSPVAAPFVKQWRSDGLAILRALQKRKETLKCIARGILDHNLGFFSGDTTTIQPLTLQTLSQEIDLHPSTISRATHDKTVSCPQGIFPIRHFFSASLKGTLHQKVSSSGAKQKLKEFILRENRNRPYSDTDLQKALLKQGIICSRRTVAKYRSELGFFSIQKRLSAYRTQSINK